MQSNIEKLKEIKKKAANKKKEGVSSTVESADKKTSLLSFDNFEAEADDGEVFRVKKSSQSRRLMKQKRAERRHKDRVGDDAPPLPCDEDLPLPNGLPPPPLPPMPPPPPVIDDDDIGIRVKNNLVINNKTNNVRMLSGYEAEALHMEDEDLNDESEEEKDPLQEILQSGAIPDAAAIYAARKRRQAVRERGAKIPDNKDNNGSQRDFIALNADRRSARSKDHEEDDSGDEESRIVMAGVRSNAALREESIKAVIEVEEEEADHARWEDQQIRKAMKVGGAAAKSGTASPDYDDLSSPNPNRHIIGRERYPHHEAPASYNLEGIKDRLKKRLTLLDEVHKRHTSDADKIADELFASQTSIDERQARLPEVIRRHHFYQDLRGYVTDLVECYDEKLNNIKYVEERYHKSKSDMCQKMIERRRDDVRDQMRELSTNAVKPLQLTAEESNEEWARQRRAAEREGRRRRRAQLRSAKAGQMPPHNDGMSSDDELPSHDQATVAKSRQDVENQARTIMSDVVEEFSTIGGVLNRIQEWKETDPSAYDDAFVSLCLPKIVSPLVTLQLLFWNPIEVCSTWLIRARSSFKISSLKSHFFPPGTHQSGGHGLVRQRRVVFA
jgi:GC-rich sequence DNA-binding factor